MMDKSEKKQIEQEKKAMSQTGRSRKTFVYSDSLDGIMVGDYLIFGEYPYSESGEKKPLQWIVMEIEKDKLFLISRYVIDIMQYHTDSKQMLWYNSYVRKWLNTEFINAAFLSEFNENIIPTRIKYQLYNDTFWRIENSNYCIDKVFLLGYEELLKYWPTPSYAKAQKIGNGVPYSKRKAPLTPYAKMKEYIDPNAIECLDHHIYNYLLRDVQKNRITCVISKPAVLSANVLGFYSHHNTIPDGIRPAMWVKK